MSLDPSLESDSVHRPQRAELTERERSILDFENRWWKHAGAKDQAIREHFGLSATTYYQVLNGLLDRQEALAHQPMLVKRLRRLRTTRRRVQTGRVQAERRQHG